MKLVLRPVLSFCMVAPMAAAQAGVPNSAATPLSWNLYEGYTQSFTVPYVPFSQSGPVQFGQPGLGAVLGMRAAIGGSIVTFQLDTGSRGIAVSRDLLPVNFPTGGKPGHIFYWSSGNRLNGNWIETQVGFPDAVNDLPGSAAQAQATLPILVVESETCVAAPPGQIFPNHCSDPGVTKPVTGVTMMGIGFDRTGHGDVPNNNRWNQQFNPFLNLDAMRSGAMRAGYILTPNGVQLGLTAANTGPNYAFQKLIPTGLKQVPGSPPDWQAPTGFVTLNGTAYPLGQAVVDTGISDMLLTLPGQPNSGNLAAGALDVSLLDSNGLVGYSFDVTDTQDPLTPSSVTWSSLQPGRWSENKATQAFVNTGIRALNAFNFLYDGTGGYIGLQLNGAAANVSAHLSPVISARGTLQLPGRFATDMPVILQGPVTAVVSAGYARIEAPISGSGGLVVKGKGGLELACDATYTGVTVVNSGSVFIYSKLAGKLKRMPGAVVVQESSQSGSNCQ